MACNCKHMSAEIAESMADLAKFRVLFIKRMTEDSETQDRRRREFNQAIFNYCDDGSTFAVWSETDVDMVLKCFDDAVKDFRRTFCDVDRCSRK